MRVNWTEVVEETAHRPWPLPSRPWVMTMTWLDLLLVHWPVAPEQIARTLPEGLQVDTWDDRAWLTVVPFEMANTMPRGATWLPKQFQFPELNLRTYVTAAGEKPGVWFYSLDATSPVAVAGARAAFNLPYYWASMTIDRTAPDGMLRYTSRRTHPGAPRTRFKARYRPMSHPSVPPSGSFEEWLVERYCLYASNAAGGLFRADVHHRPWALCDVEAEIEVNTLDTGFDFSLSTSPAAAQYAHRVDVVGWWPTRV